MSTGNGGEKLRAAIDAHTTPQLLSYMAHLETMTSTPETRLLGALIVATITAREGADLAARRVQHRHTNAEGSLLNERDRPIAIVHWDGQPLPTWADWSDLTRRQG